MSPVHGSQGQQYARPPAQAQNQWGQGAPASPAAPQSGYPNAAGYPQQQVPPAGYGVQETYGQHPGTGQAPLGPLSHPNDYGYGERTQSPQAYPGGAQGYAPQFEPYIPTQPTQATQPRPQAYPGGYQQQPQAPAYVQQPASYGGVPTYVPSNSAPPQGWNQAHDNRGFDLGTYMPHHQPSLGGQDQAGAHNDWSLGGYQGDTDGYAGNEHAGDHGFAQSQGGELDQGYAEDEGEGQDYEIEEPARGRRPVMMAAVLAGAIAIGGGLMYTYKTVLGGGAGGDPPVVKSAAAPSKVKPEDGGGKQFSHTDSKIMGRLGDGSGTAAAGSEVDSSGTRKVSTLVVGRDGSIQAPAAANADSAAPAPAAVSVPGMTVVDGLGPSRAPAAAATMASVNTPAPKATQEPAGRIAVSPSTSPAPQKPVTVAKAAVTPPPPAPAPDATTASIEPDAAAAAPVKPTIKKTKTVAAAAAPAAVPSNSVATTGNGANGFVAVLASVPRSDTSRMDALKRFADMQQKYAGVLSGKTPDVAEANLGTKGAYHRLVVGPPGSREQASGLCTQLKAQGYTDCWVTTY